MALILRLSEQPIPNSLWTWYVWHKRKMIYEGVSQFDCVSYLVQKHKDMRIHRLLQLGYRIEKGKVMSL